MTELLEAAIYGLMQGLTEFLPVSSSGHLALYTNVFDSGVSDAPLALPVLVHVASLVAVLIVFHRQVARLFSEDRRLGIFICIATLPAVVAGFLFHGFVESLTHRPTVVAVFLMVTGLVLIVGEVLARRREIQGLAEQQMALWQTVAVGMAQAFALLPGISRSGMTISVGRSLGLSPDASVRFAFLLAVPAIAGAGCYELLKMIQAGGEVGIGLLPAVVAFVAALGSSWLALVVLIRIVRRVGLWVFSPYCFVVGACALAYFAWT